MVLGSGEGIRDTGGRGEGSRELDRDPEANTPRNLSRFRRVSGWWLGVNEGLPVPPPSGDGPWDCGIFAPTMRLMYRDIWIEAW